MGKFKNKKNNILNDNQNIKNNELCENKKNYITHKKKNKKKEIDDNELFDDDCNFINHSFIDKSMKSNNDNNTHIVSKPKTSSSKIFKVSGSKASSSSQTNLNIKKSRSSSISSPNGKIYKKIEDKNIFFNELLKKQIKGISTDKKLNYNDIKRISKFIKSSVFDKNKCSIWNGYITNENNNLKGTYINFYFNKKKIALHRLLYLNYIGHLSDNEYLKFSCENRGKCCNVYHMKKYTYNNKKSNKSKSEIKKSNNMETKLNNQEEQSEMIHINVDKKKLIVEI